MIVYDYFIVYDLYIIIMLQLFLYNLCILSTGKTNKQTNKVSKSKYHFDFKTKDLNKSITYRSKLRNQFLKLGTPEFKMKYKNRETFP